MVTTLNSSFTLSRRRSPPRPPLHQLLRPSHRPPSLLRTRTPPSGHSQQTVSSSPSPGCTPPQLLTRVRAATCLHGVRVAKCWVSATCEWKRRRWRFDAMRWSTRCESSPRSVAQSELDANLAPLRTANRSDARLLYLSETLQDLSDISRFERRRSFPFPKQAYRHPPQLQQRRDLHQSRVLHSTPTGREKLPNRGGWPTSASTTVSPGMISTSLSVAVRSRVFLALQSSGCTTEEQTLSRWLYRLPSSCRR